MAFWKKKSDAPENRGGEKNAVSIPSWYHREEPSEPETCPWCGAPMVRGTLYGNARGCMQWREGPYQGGLDALRFTDRKVDLSGGEEAWFCEPCQKMTMDIGRALESAGPNYVWEGGKPVLKTRE